MSWQMLDGPSRRPRLSWAVPEHLRDNTRYGPFRRLSVPAPFDPDALLQYIDNAISITENAQATRHLSRQFASSLSSSASLPSSSPLPSSSSSSSSAAVASPAPSLSLLSSASSLSVGHLRDGGPSLMPPVPSARKLSRFKSVSPEPKAYINSSLKHNNQEEASSASKPSLPAASNIMNVEPLDEQGSSKTDRFPLKSPDRTKSQQISEVEGVSKGDQMSAKGEEFDARAADDAYRAACCALSEGNAEVALSLLHVASVKCPPDKQNALGKVHRLMAAALQLMDKNSAVLRSLPVDNNAS